MRQIQTILKKHGVILRWGSFGRQDDSAYVWVEDESKHILPADRKVWKAFRAYGPVNDGRPEGDAFDEALTELMKSTKESTYARS